MWHRLLYQENHAFDAWFKKAYGEEQKSPVTIKVRSANCTNKVTGRYIHNGNE